MTKLPTIEEESLKKILNQENPVRHCCGQRGCDNEAAEKFLSILIKAYGIDQQIKELETLLANVPMPSLSYEQVENRIKQLKSQKGGK